MATPAFADSPQIGPLRIGMSIDDVRAATPGIQWTDVTPFSKGIYQIEAQQVVSLASTPFDAQVTVGQRIYRLHLSTSVSVASAADCESKAVVLVTDLEPKLGEFGWDANTLLPGREALLHVGQRSAAMISGWTSTFKPVDSRNFSAGSTTGFGFRTRRVSTVDDTGSITINVTADLEGMSCRMAVDLSR